MSLVNHVSGSVKFRTYVYVDCHSQFWQLSYASVWVLGLEGPLVARRRQHWRQLLWERRQLQPFQRERAYVADRRRVESRRAAASTAQAAASGLAFLLLLLRSSQALGSVLFDRIKAAFATGCITTIPCIRRHSHMSLYRPACSSKWGRICLWSIFLHVLTYDQRMY